MELLVLGKMGFVFSILCVWLSAVGHYKMCYEFDVTTFFSGLFVEFELMRIIIDI